MMFPELNNSPLLLVSNRESVQQAINDASTGDVIILLPGTYTENFTIDKKIRMIGMGAGFTNLTGEITNSVHDTAFKDIKFGSATSVSVLQSSAYRYHMENCEVECTTWAFPTARCKFKNCQFWPMSAGGWIVSGAAKAIFHQCIVGQDFLITDAKYGIAIADGGQLACYQCDINSNNPAGTYPTIALTGASSKFMIVASRMASEVSTAIQAADSGGVIIDNCYIECGASGETPTVKVSDDVTLKISNSRIKSNIADDSLHINTTIDTQIAMSMFYGKVTIGDPDAGEAGDTKWMGANAIYAEGGTAVTDPNGYSIGRPFTHIYWGKDVFTATGGDKTVTVKGAPTAAANIAGFLMPVHTDEVTAYEAKLAIETALGQFEAHREENAGNISGMEFKFLDIFFNEAES